MQTRRQTLKEAAMMGASSLKPTVTSVFKRTKVRASTRTLVSKPSAIITEAKEQDFIEPMVASMQSTTKTRQTSRTRKTASSTSSSDTGERSMTETTKAVTTSKVEAKVKVSEVNPWMKRSTHVPHYAPAALEHLCRVDPAMLPLVSKHPYSIYDDHDTNYFRVLTRTILGQQIHWRAARSIIYKFVSFYFPDQVTIESLDEGDKTFPSPDQVLNTSMEKLRLCGLSERKASYVQDLAKHFSEGKITFTDKAMLQSMADEEIAAQLLCVRGIGPWTVDMFMMNSLERLDVLPTLDLGIRKGMEKHFRGEYKNGVWGVIQDMPMKETGQAEEGRSDVKKIVKKKLAAKGKGRAKNGEMTCEDMERMAERWRPYRSIASWYMWRNADAENEISAPIV